MDVYQQHYTAASLKTADNLRSIAQSQMLRDLSALTLPEIDATVELVSRVVPAGNVPGVILNGLARLAGRKPPPNVVKRDINLLFKGVEQTLDKAVYGAFFAGPAAAIWGYQNLLKLAGKDPEDSFPDGTWQFYVEYALREDTARHANETRGFDKLLKQHGIELSPVDRATAWVAAATRCLHQYPLLLENEWRERVGARLLAEVGGPERYGRLYREWEKQRPYERGPEAEPHETYPAYRRRRFDLFLAERSREMSPDQRREWEKRLEAAQAEQLPAYQQQLAILAYLEPGPYGENRVPISFKQAQVGLIYQGRYYLIPAALPAVAGGDKPADVAALRSQVATIFAYPAGGARPPTLAPLAGIKRSALASLRQKLEPRLVKELDRLRLAPILINCDQRPAELPLAELRQAERGVGDQPLTILDTGEAFIFDQSHIFFDGGWGAALAEIMTNEALAWAVYLHNQPAPKPQQARPYSLELSFRPADQELVRRAPAVTAEVSAETDRVNLKAMLSLRKLFKRRNDLLNLTINDLLVLYRAIHAVTYPLAPVLAEELRQLSRVEATRPAAEAALAALEPGRQSNPAIVIPVDASQRNPRDRLYPMTFEVPLAELDLLDLHQRAVKALDAYQAGSGDRSTAYGEFDRLQRSYLATLAGFGLLLGRSKEVAGSGESASVGGLKMLAHMPVPIQRLLDKVPNRFEVLNDLLKGREVLSNVGAVAPTSSLTRFITAKDDNDQKTLAWGAMTDSQGVLRLTLRDFRPHVGLLAAAGHKELAVQVAQDYLQAYAAGLNSFVRDLHRITQTSRETRLEKVEKDDD